MNINDYMNKIESSRQNPILFHEENPHTESGKFKIFFKQYERGIYNDTGTDYASAVEYDVILYFQDTIKNYGEFKELQELFDQAFEKFAPDYFPLLPSGVWLQWNSFYVRKVYSNRYIKQIVGSLYPEEELAECLSWSVLDSEKHEWERWTKLKNLLLKDCLDYIEPKLKELLSETIIPQKPVPDIPPGLPIKVSRHGLENKIFNRQVPARVLGTDILTKMESSGIDVSIEQRSPIEVGMDLNPHEDKAYWAINKLFSDTNWKGRGIDGGEKAKPVMIYEKKGGRESLLFRGISPILEISKAEYLEAYGVPKRKTSRGKMEFDSQLSVVAWNALISLTEKIHTFYYERKAIDKRGHQKIEIVKHRSPLLFVEEIARPITHDERNAQIGVHGANITEEKRKAGKLVYIRVEGHFILFDEIDSNFALFPPNIVYRIQDVINIRRRIGESAPEGVKILVGILGHSVSKKRSQKESPPWTYESNYKKIAEKIGYSKLVKQGKKTALRRTLDAVYDTCIDIGCILKYETTNGLRDEKDVLYLNPKFFPGDKKVEQGTFDLSYETQNVQKIADPNPEKE